MLPEGYTEGGTSTGVTSVLMTERPTKKNKLKEIQDVFYTKSDIAKRTDIEFGTMDRQKSIDKMRDQAWKFDA